MNLMQFSLVLWCNKTHIALVPSQFVYILSYDGEWNHARTRDRTLQRTILFDDELFSYYNPNKKNTIVNYS